MMLNRARTAPASTCFMQVRGSKQNGKQAPPRDMSINIHIDRRHHMEIAWKRQMQIEADIAAELRRGPDGVVWQVRDLAHLDRIHKASGGRLVVMLAYNRSCGSCKRAVQWLQQMSRQSASAKAGVVHCKHDTMNEFDFASDVSRMYGVRHVPSFLIFHEGALLDRQRLPDSRAGPYGSVKQIDSLLDIAMRQVQSRVRKQVFRLAPSASMPPPEAPTNVDNV
eukprot:jgi/Ulvmu1/10850/UM007_0024.1